MNHVCPVTKKPLMEVREDDESAATSFSYEFDDDAADDASFPAPVNRSRPRQADSEFALLNKEIVNFQVRENLTDAFAFRHIISHT